MMMDLNLFIMTWPYLKKHKIPFILFISTEPVGKFGYMNWDEINEIEESEFGFIGHHSHTHEYLIDMKDDAFINDIETATKIFKEKLDIHLKSFHILLVSILST